MNIKIKDDRKFDKTFFNKLSKISTMNILKESEDTLNIYEFSNIKNEDLFIYEIAKQINKIGIQYYFKNMLKNNFKTKEINEIIKNHKEKTTEMEYFEFIMKIKLTLFFHNDNVLNVNSFFKFNLKEYIKELHRFAELEIDSNGKFLEELEEENNNNIINKIVEFITKLKEENKNNTYKYQDFYVYYKKDKLNILMENNKHFKFLYQKEISEFYKNLEENEINYDLLNLIIQIGVLNPERIILYKSLDTIDNFLDNFLNFFGFLSVSKIINSDLYKSNEETPHIKGD